MRHIFRGMYASSLALFGLIYCSVRRLITLDFERDLGFDGLTREQKRSARRARTQLQREQERLRG